MTINSADEFVRLRESTNPAEYHRAGHEEATLEVWRDVIERYPDMRKWVAYNKTVPLEILATLASDPDWYVRSTVAMKRKLTPDLLDQLAADKSKSIRMQVAQTPRYREIPPSRGCVTTRGIRYANKSENGLRRWTSGSRSSSDTLRQASG